MSHSIDGARSSSWLQPLWPRLGLATIMLLIGISATTISCLSDSDNSDDQSSSPAMERAGHNTTAATEFEGHNATEVNKRSTTKITDKHDGQLQTKNAFVNAPATTDIGAGELIDGVFADDASTSGAGSTETISGCGDPKTCTERP